ncbi:hypothetical protein G7Y79_00017g043010 [Physcia stellaris]|nr:hypothetical protein G7Y79_00017g043010 [Physcia stellaris]
MASTDAAEVKWPAKRVRETFFKFFVDENGHTFVQSSSVVPHADPSLLFANAGMNQYKPIFLGTVDPSSAFASLKRAVNSQKCIRAGGKHNDLDDVGKDSYHHTFFEMLGNWSFGDYFKKEAIGFSWRFLTVILELDPDRLYVTYFEGNPDSGLEPDLEAKELWKSVGVAEDHILPGDMKDNFWEMGDQGPCGPCSEVHYDRIGGRNAAHLVNQDDPNVLEIWNNVFIQYNREPDRSLRSLPAKHIDTGLGFERLVSILQDKPSNYDTDVFTPLFAKIQEITGAREYQGKFGPEDPDGIDTAYRVVADHVRTLSFAIADGAPPNNEGRGKYLATDIGEFFSKIVPTLVEQMGDVFPELKKKEAEIKEILDEEEQSFAKTLDRGEHQFEKYAQDAKKTGSNKLPGTDVWRLYDTFGFPMDLTQLMAEERGLTIDDSEVETARLTAKERSKGVKKEISDLLKLDVHGINQLESMSTVTKTDDDPKYEKGNITSVIQSVYHNKQFLDTTKQIPEGEQLGILVNRTNFYAEQGGQENDTGKIIIDGQAELEVDNVQLYAGYVLHTGTHILNFALREVLGDDINQRGSLVAPEKLRFDFSHMRAVTPTELEKIEDICTRYIRQACPVYSKDVPLKTAEQINGLRAVFGESYPDPVRVVSVGVEVEELLKDVKNEEWRKVSVEFCGGTHVKTTSDIKELIILEESGIAKGIRRIIAVTGLAAEAVQRLAKLFEERIARLEKMQPGEAKEVEVKAVQAELNGLQISTITKKRLGERFDKVYKAQLDLQKAAQKAEGKKALEFVQAFFKANREATSLVTKLEISANAKAVGEAINHFKTKDKGKSVYLFAADGEKVVHGCYVSEATIGAGGSANDWATRVSAVVGGKAGGKAPTSIGNGTEPERVDEAVLAAQEYLGSLKL